VKSKGGSGCESRHGQLDVRLRDMG
jgi:hypothetical protein